MVYIGLADPNRLPILIFEWIFVILSAELGIISLLKYRREEPQLRSSQELGYFSLFFGFSISWILFIVGDFYVSDVIQDPFYLWSYGSFRDLFVIFGLLSFLICTTIFIYITEKNDKNFSKKYLFSSIFVIFTIILSIFIMVDLKFPHFISIVIWPILLLFFSIYFVRFFKGVENRWANLMKILIPFLLILGSIIISSEFFLSIYGLEVRLLGSIVQAVSIGALAFFFIQLPAFSEFEWQDKIEELLVMNKGGVCIFHKTFGDKVSHLNEVLMSGALLSVNILLSELTSTSEMGTSVIKKTEKTVNLYSTELLRGVLISSEELDSIKYYLKEFIEKVESIYNTVLQDWDGHVELFAPVDAIANEIFLKK